MYTRALIEMRACDVNVMTGKLWEVMCVVAMGLTFATDFDFVC